MAELVSGQMFHTSETVVSCELDGGSALLDLESSTYYKLNSTAALIWSWIGEGATIDTLVAEMLNHFDIDETQCRSDVQTIVSEFENSGLVLPSAVAAG